MTDHQFLNFLKDRNNELQLRYNKEIRSPRGIGNTVKGTIHDVNRKSFERALKDVDKELYLVWNPFAKEGQGCWQIWITPTKKRLVHQTTFEGNEIFTLEHKTLPVEHYICDVPHLNYEVIGRLRASRLTVDEILNQDYEARRKVQKEEESARDERKHMVRQTRQYWKAFKEHVQSGYNPMWFFDQNRKSMKEDI